MEVLDTSIANVALKYIAGSVAASYDEATWVLTSYLISNAIILPLSGWLSERVGRKRFYMSCVAIFTISSLCCGLAPSLGFLLVARIIQGAGGGGLAPSEQAILTDTFPPAKRGAAFALYGIAVVVAPAVGPTLGGWLTDTYSWRWIFFINVPVGILSLTLTHFIVPSDPKTEKGGGKAEKKKKDRVDYLGFGLVALWLGCLQVVLDRGQMDDWFGSTLITTFAIISAVSFVLLIIHELTFPQPAIDLRLFANRNFLFANIAMFMFGATLFSAVQMLPQYSQQLLGYNATVSGLTISGGGVLVLLLLPFVGWLLGRMQAKYLVAFGFVASSIALWYTARALTLQSSFEELVIVRCYQAIGLAFLFVPINTAAYTGLPKGKSNHASALLNLLRNMGGSVGIAVAQTMVDRRSQFHQSRLGEHLSRLDVNFYNALHGWYMGQTGTGPANVSMMSQTLKQLYQSLQNQAAMLGYIDVFQFMSIAAMFAVISALFLKRSKPGQGAHGG